MKFIVTLSVSIKYFFSILFHLRHDTTTLYKSSKFLLYFLFRFTISIAKKLLVLHITNMELPFTYNITYGLIAVLLVLLLRCYWSIRKKFSGFPVVHAVPYFLYSQVTGEFPKDVPVTNIIFEKLVDEGKQHISEGLFMTYTTRPVLFIFSEEGVKFFLNDKAASDKSHEYKFLQDYVGNGINLSSGERWRTHRKMINPVFHLGKLKEKVPLFNEHALALVGELKTLAGETSIEFLDALKCHYFNALSESIFGLKQSEEHREENLKFFSVIDSGCYEMVKQMSTPWLQWKLFKDFLPFGRNLSRMKTQYETYVKNVISDMKKFILSNKTMDGKRFSDHLKKSFSYIMLENHLNDPTFTLVDVYDEVSTMLTAGYDTVSYSTYWCLFLLGLHPEVQEKAFNEIQQTTGSSVTYEDTYNLVYLESIIMETLRLYPTLPIFGRNLSEDVQFGKYKVSKDTTVGIFPYLLHRNPEIYHNPENFEPDRFLNVDTKKTWSFIPFSVGSRSCIGKKYALIEMKIFLAHILRNFKIVSCDRQEDVRLCYTIVTTPAKLLRMKVIPRHEKFS